MKKYLRFLVIFIISIFVFIGFVPQLRANFTESVSEIIFSLRGVEEEAVNVFVPSPPEPEIVIGNSESEALTAEQVLYEESIKALSAVGTCDLNVGEENRYHAEQIYNKLNNGESNLGNYSQQRNEIETWINSLEAELIEEGSFYKLIINKPNNVDVSFKIFINDNEINLKNYTNASQFLFKNYENIDNLKVIARDSLGAEFESKTVRIKKNINSQCKNCYVEGNFRLASSGISPQFSELPKGLSQNSEQESGSEDTSTSETTTSTSTTTTTIPERPQAVFNQPEINNSFDINGTIGNLSFTPGVNVKYYKFELNGQVVYSQSPSIQVVDALSNLKTETINIELINEYGEVGSRFYVTIRSPLEIEKQQNSNINFQNVSGYEIFYTDENEYNNLNFDAQITDVEVLNSVLKFNINEVPDGFGIVILNENSPLALTSRQNIDINTGTTHNIKFVIPPSYSGGQLYLKLVKGSGSQSNKSLIPLSESDLEILANNSLDSLAFKPQFNTTIENYEEERNKKGGGMLYDLLGPTQVEFGWRPLYQESAYLVKSFNFYVNGECVATQRAWNIIEGEFDKNPVSTIDQITYAILGRLPQLSDVNVEVRAVGFNNVESEPDFGTFRTFLEPQVTLYDIGLIDTKWIVYGEYAYVYYHISTTRAEYENYNQSGNTFYLQVKMCCNEEGRVYYPTIKFIPVPDYATCSDLTIVGKTSKDNPAFLGIRTNPNLEVVEFIKNDNGDELSFEESGGQLQDIIYSVNGKEVFSEVQLADEINKFTGGQQISITVGRNGIREKINITLSSYPERFDIEAINKATGCFDVNGQAIGVFKVLMKEGFSKNQYASSFYFYQKDASAESRYPPEDMVYGGNKEFNRNGNIYSGMGPADSLVSYGTHNVDFNNTVFTISSNSQRRLSRSVLLKKDEINLNQNNEDESRQINEDSLPTKEIFIPSETRPEPYSMYASQYEDYEDLQKKGIVPVVNGNTIGDCCYRDETRSEGGRIFESGTYAFYFSTKNPRVLEGWDVFSETCSIVIFDLPYDFAVENKNFLRNSYKPESSNYPVITEITVDKEFECFFDISEFKEYPYLAFNAKTCYVNKDGDQYFCLEIPYIILPISSWG